MSFMGMDFGYPDEPVVFGPKARFDALYHMEVDIPLVDIPPGVLRLFVGEDCWANMYHQQEADARWEGEGGACL